MCGDFVYSQLVHTKTVKEKYDFIGRIIVFNPFMNKKTKRDYMLSVYNYQNILWCINIIKRQFKRKRIKKSNVDIDLFLSPLNEIPIKLKIDIVQDNVLYTFSLSDCYRLVDESLCNNEFFFIIPTHPRNPYTNIEFNIGNIMKICDTLKKIGMINSFILSYMECGYNLTEFRRKNVFRLREHTIKMYINNLSLNLKFFKLKEMFFAYCGRTLIPFRNDVEKNRLLCQFKSELYLEYFGIYCDYHDFRFRHSDRIQRRLSKFIKNNFVLFTSEHILP